MDAKEYLMQIRQWDARIDVKQKQMEAIKDRLTHITPVLKEDAGSGGGFHDKIGEGVAKLVDLDREINEDIDRLVDLKREAMTHIGKLTNPKYYKVLCYRYDLGMTWDQIAGELDMTTQGAHKLHRNALRVLTRLMKN